MPCLPDFTRRIRRLLRGESGAGSVLGLTLLVLSFLVGGVAIDTANAWRVREILQSNAEAAALSAAIRASEVQHAARREVRGTARLTARHGLAEAGLTDAWYRGSFRTGRLAPESGNFVPTLSDWTAVEVKLSRHARTGNAEPLTWLRPFGYERWNLEGRALAEVVRRDHVDCIDPLLSLKARVDISEVDAFVGICLFAQATVDYGARPLWVDAGSLGLVNALVAEAIGLNITQPLMQNVSATPELLRQAVAGADRSVNLSDLDDISVLADEKLHVVCGEDDVLTLRDGTVIENAAIYADCPINFRGKVTIRASLVVSNLLSVLGEVPQVRLEPAALLSGSPACAPGNGLRVLLFADVGAVAEVPALVSTDTPLGAFLDDSLGAVGGLLGWTLDQLGLTLDTLEADLNRIASDFQLLPVCLNVDTMVSSKTAVLR
ncbi:hypothetical protein [Mesobacterium pallidum]|uniref:hypothetical protein n=1 Tax=Mesobacterium pallidum TaxID=2872037 RepID=UPI001EE2A4E0|nr:hypothetical protein [Mesobacterium pallidum]